MHGEVDTLAWANVQSCMGKFTAHRSAVGSDISINANITPPPQLNTTFYEPQNRLLNKMEW